LVRSNPYEIGGQTAAAFDIIVGLTHLCITRTERR
jgi:hypothetical protein